MADALAEAVVEVAATVDDPKLAVVAVAVGAASVAVTVLVSRDKLGAGDAVGVMTVKSGLSTRTFKKMMSAVASRISKMIRRHQHMRLRFLRGSVCLHEHLWTPASLSERTLTFTVCSLCDVVGRAGGFSTLSARQGVRVGVVCAGPKSARDMRAARARQVFSPANVLRSS